MLCCFTPIVQEHQKPKVSTSSTPDVRQHDATKEPLTQLTQNNQTTPPTFAAQPAEITESIKPILSNTNRANNKRFGKLSNLTFKSQQQTINDTLAAFATEGYLIIKGFSNQQAMQQLKEEVIADEIAKPYGLHINELDIKFNEKNYSNAHEFGMALLHSALPGLQPPKGKCFKIVPQVIKRPYEPKNSERIHQDPGVVHFLMPLSEEHLNTICLTPKIIKELSQNEDFARLLPTRFFPEKTDTKMEPIKSKPGDIAVFPNPSLNDCQINAKPLHEIYPKEYWGALWHATPSEETAKAKTGSDDSAHRYLLSIGIQLDDIEPEKIQAK